VNVTNFMPDKLGRGAYMRLRIFYVLLSLTLLASCGDSGNGGPPPPPATDHFAYVSNSDSNSITAYKIDSTSGALGAMTGSPFGGVDAPLGLALSPGGDFLASGNLNGGGVSIFRVDKTNGSIALVAGSPFPTSGGGFPLDSKFHSSGKFLYAGMQVSTTSNVSAFSVDASTGVLTPVPGSPFSGQPAVGGGGVNSIALHPSGNYLYSSGAFLGITGYAVDSATGVLNQLAGSPFIPAGSFFNSKVVVHPSGNFLYMADFDVDGVRVFPIASDGSLGAAVASSPFATGLGPRAIALDPTGKFAYVINDGDSNVTAFTVNAATGELTFAGNTDTGVGPFDLTVDSSGKFLYVTNQSDGNVSAYSIDSSSGALSPMASSPFAAANSPISIVTTK
jgi:6-phosphogluconolactonase